MEVDCGGLSVGTWELGAEGTGSAAVAADGSVAMLRKEIEVIRGRSWPSRTDMIVEADCPFPS